MRRKIKQNLIPLLLVTLALLLNLAYSQQDKQIKQYEKHKQQCKNFSDFELYKSCLGNTKCVTCNTILDEDTEAVEYNGKYYCFDCYDEILEEEDE